jgi:hypothetical protein
MTDKDNDAKIRSKRRIIIAIERLKEYKTLIVKALCRFLQLAQCISLCFNGQFALFSL